MNGLLNYFSGKRTSHPASRRPRTFQPTFELLEARDCPSALGGEVAGIVNTISPPPVAQAAQAAQASFSPVATLNAIWSGYTIRPGNGQQVNQVSGTWVEPSYSGPGGNSIWVGIDGAGQQAGVSWYASTGYQVWVEFYGDKTQGPKGDWTGNQINVTLTANGGPVSPTNPAFIIQGRTRLPRRSSWYRALRTSSRSPSRLAGRTVPAPSNRTTPRNLLPQRGARRVRIVENPNNAAQPLANFGTVNFTNCRRRRLAPRPAQLMPSRVENSGTWIPAPHSLKAPRMLRALATMAPASASATGPIRTRPIIPRLWSCPLRRRTPRRLTSALSMRSTPSMPRKPSCSSRHPGEDDRRSKRRCRNRSRHLRFFVRVW